MFKCLALPAFCALTLLVAQTARSQTITGAITGTVTDPSGAVAPNVKVTATNVDTNQAHSTMTNSAGVYNLLFLPIGNYNVTAEAPGFKKTVLGPFRLEVNQTARVDVNMEVGQVTESVEVTGIAPILQTETTQTGDIITSTQSTELPLNGRNFVSLTLLIPGAITPNPGSFTSPSRSFSGGRPYVNGNREQSNNFLLDGVDINDSIDNVVGYNPNVDALAEMKVLTGNASAEFGNGNGAIVNMTLKSGTNSFHGNLFEFLRNDKVDANEFFNNRSGAPKRALRQNTFGGTFGGPILKDRAFFFVDYQGTRHVDSGTSLATVAPAEFRTGNLSRFTNPIIDPTTGLQFPGNVIPTDRIVNPVAKALFANSQLYPLPNQPGTGTLGILNNYVGNKSFVSNNDQADAKIDLRMSAADNLSGRFTIAKYRDDNGSVAIPAFLGSDTDAPTTGGMVTWIRTFSPTVVNEARGGFTRIILNFTTADPAGILGPNGNSLLGIPGGQPIAGLSNIDLGSTEGLSKIGSAATDSLTTDNNFQFSDNLSIQRGRHNIRTGLNVIRYQQNRFYAGNNGLLGTFTYSGQYTGNGFADFLLNQLSFKGRGSQTGRWGQRQWRPGIYVQDDFKVMSNLTLNLGLRWEYTSPLIEVANRQVNFNLQTGQPEFAGLNGNSRGLYNPYYKQFMPRVGFAWSMTPKFVVRAGYGITSYMEGTGANLRLPMNPPFFFESAVNFGLNQPGDITTGFTDVQPGSQIAGQVRAYNPDLRPAFIQQWNFSTEYQFASSFSLTAGYVGQRGRHLVDPREYNQPLPGTGPVEAWAPLQQRRPLFATAPLITNISGTDSSSNMDYNAIQVSARKRMSTGIEFLASYTLSRTLTDNLGYYGSDGVNSEGAYWQNAYDRNSDRGRAFFDALHNFSLGGVFEVPFGRSRAYGKGWNRATDLALGGWTLNYVASLHSGFPVTVQTSDTTSQAVRGGTRPNGYGNLTYQNQSIDNWFGTGNTFCGPGINDGSCAYGQPLPGTFGTAAKGTENAPAFRNLDITLGKKFSVTESQYLDFRADFFNVFNHTNFGPPLRTITSPDTFGQISSTVGSPRNIQFGLKYYF
jgi:hypothetical protein